MKIREIENSELPILKKLMAELGYPLNEEELLNNVKRIRERGGITFVAEIEGKITGCITGIISTGLSEGVYGEIISLVVFKEYRGKGIGKALVVKVEQWLKPQVKKIRVRANNIRQEAPLFYKSLGYREIKTQVSFIKEI